jgi:hypothetical protein
MTKVLVCYNCMFKKNIKNDIEALVIIRNHNTNRDAIFSKKHIMRVLDSDELRPVSNIPYYEGKVYRTICKCSTIFDRKSNEGLEYSMAYHIITAKQYDDHEFKHFQVLKREDYISRTKNPSLIYWEAYHRQGLSDADISTETSIATFDPNIFWNNNTSSFNYINDWIFKSLSDYRCPGCDNYTDSFKALYWHYYRKHYLNEVTKLSQDEIKTLRDERHRLENTQSLYYHTNIPHDGSVYNRLDEIKKILGAYEYERYIGKDLLTFRDIVISQLQSLVMIEQSDRKKNKFNRDRRANALYQLNRRHGVSMSYLAALFNASSVGDMGKDLFHGMVWTENKAPDWLDNVVKTLGIEIGI